MAIYLDQKRRCDNCLSELGTMITACKGEMAYKCHKELCPRCAGKHGGWCQDCFDAECFWLYGDDSEPLYGDDGEPMDEDEVTELLIAEEQLAKAHDQQKLDQWNKMAPAKI
jgi:hypothetical protein